MSRKPAGVFSGGWTPAKAEKFNSIQLPDKSRCKGCHKLKPVDQYSTKQQLDLKHRIAGHQGEKAKLPTAEIITCRPCTSGQTQELTCMICNESKGLEAFGKTQRKTPDYARCIVCVHEQGKEKWAHIPWEVERSDEEDSDDDFRSRTVTNPYEEHDDSIDGVSFALKEVNLAAYHNAQVQAAAKKGSTIACESDLLKSYSDDECTQEPSGKGKGKEEEPTDWQKFAANNPGKEFTGYDPTGGAHRQVRGPSTIASDRSLEIVTDTPRGRSGYSKGKGGRSQFVKAPRGPSPPMRKDNVIEKLKATGTGRFVSYENDEDSTDEEWGCV